MERTGSTGKYAGTVMAAVCMLLMVAGRLSAQEVRYYDVPSERLTEAKRPTGGEAAVTRVENTADACRITVSVPIRFDNHWLSFSPGMYVRDRLTDRTVYIDRLEDGLPTDRVLRVNGMKGKTVDFVLVFPALPGARRIEIGEDMSKSCPTPENGTAWHWFVNLNESGYGPVADDESYVVTRVVRPRGRYVTRIRPIGSQDYGRVFLKKVAISKKETILTMKSGRPIRKIGNDLRIMDCLSGDIYPIRGLNRRLQPGQYYRAVRHGKIKLYFPPLKPTVRKIDVQAGNEGVLWKEVYVKNMVL